MQQTETRDKNKHEAAQTLRCKIGRGKDMTTDVDSQGEGKEKGGALGEVEVTSLWSLRRQQDGRAGDVQQQ